MNAILNEEAERLGLKGIRQLQRIQERQIEESLTSDFLLSASRIVRDSFVDRGYDATRTAIVPYGVDLNRFHPIAGQATPDKPFTVISVGAISPRKGHVYLLEAWKKLALPEAELLLIGSISPEMTAILGRYDGLFQHVSIRTESSIVRVLCALLRVVLPSFEDGFAVVRAEAMACGLAAIVTDNAGPQTSSPMAMMAL